MTDRFKVLHDDGTEDWLTREEALASLNVQGGADPLQVAELVAAYLQAHPPAGGAPAGRLIDFGSTIEMWQGGTRIGYHDAKVVCQGFYVPGGLSWLEYLLAFTDTFIDNLPDVDLMIGGEWEWRLPWGHRLAKYGEPDLRGYFTFAGGVYYADHPRTMPAVGMIRTVGPNICYAALRVDMYPLMAHNPDQFGEEKGVLNRRRPWGKWTPGSWLKFTLAYPTE